MSFFEELKKTFSNKEEIFLLRYNSSKFVFILCSFLFFLSYFFIANSFYDKELLLVFPFLYVAFLLSICIYSCFFIAKALYKFPKVIKIIIYIVFILITLFLSLPIVFPKWFINIF